MKNPIYAIVAFLLSLFILSACKKSDELKLSTAKPASAKASVTDSVPTPPVQYNIVSLKGDQITLVPHFYNNSAADSSYIYFVAQTSKYYCGISHLDVSSSLVNNTFSLGFLDVVQPSPCTIGQGPIGWVVNFLQNNPGPFPTGTFPLKVTLNDTTYTGSIISSSTSISFDWNYTKGVLISPKQINR